MLLGEALHEVGFGLGDQCLILLVDFFLVLERLRLNGDLLPKLLYLSHALLFLLEYASSITGDAVRDGRISHTLVYAIVSTLRCRNLRLSEPTPHLLQI